MQTPNQLPDLRKAARAIVLDAEAAVLAARSSLHTIDSACAECSKAEAFLSDLPVDGSSPQIMVPLTGAAFLPGRLTDTRHCQLRMADGSHLDCTTEEAVGILRRRQGGLAQQRAGTAEQLKALEQRLAVAAAALAAPLGQQGGAGAGEDNLVDIREEYDEALHGPLPSHGRERQASGVQASSTATRPAAGSGSSGREPLAVSGLSGTESARADRAAATASESVPKKSVTFGPAEGAAKAGSRQSGLKKGFLDAPKPVLKKLSSVGASKSPSQDSAPLVSVLEQQVLDEGREAAFSGRVVERDASTAAAAMQPAREEEGLPNHGNGHGQASSVKRVSRFKQQRAGMG